MVSVHFFYTRRLSFKHLYNDWSMIVVVIIIKDRSKVYMYNVAFNYSNKYNGNRRKPANYTT